MPGQRVAPRTGGGKDRDGGVYTQDRKCVEGGRELEGAVPSITRLT